MGCCNKFEVWGVRANTPCFLASTTHSPTEPVVPYDYEGHDALEVLGPNETPIGRDVRPEVRTCTPQIFNMSLVKVPSSWPDDKCDESQPMDSGDVPLGDGTFTASIGPCTEHKVSPDPGVSPDYLHNWRFVFNTRAIRHYGDQKWIAVRLGGSHVNPAGFEPSGPFIDDDALGGLEEHGDIVLVDVATQAVIATYYTATVNDIGEVSWTLMEKHYLRIFPIDVQAQIVGGDRANPIAAANVDTVSGKQFAAQCEQFSRNYYLVSSYNPDCVNWGVARVKLEGTRLGEATTNGAPAMEVFSTGSWTSATDGNCTEAGTLTPEDFANPNLIVLPSCRVDIRGDDDECWVVTMTIGEDRKVGTGRWLSKVYRPGVGSEDEETGAADGTLADGEIENWITGIGTQANDDFGDEAASNWANLRILCYNHLFGKDYIFFTTQADPQTDDTIMADFEQPGTPDPDNLDNAIDTKGLHFVTGGTRTGDKWIADATDPIEGSYSARTNEGDVTSAGNVDLSLTIIVVGDDDMRLLFKFKLDNRRYGSHQSGPPWVTLTNTPEPDNFLAVYDNGRITDINIEGTPYLVADGGSKIDHVNVPTGWDNTEEWFTTARDAYITLTPGTHTIRWSQHREWQDNGHLHSWIDNVEPPNLMLGEDITGRRRYFYDGAVLRRATEWDWAQRDKENETVLTGRVSTEPTFITADGRGHVYYGNCHAVLCFHEADGTLDTTFGDKGYIRGTASPNTAAPSEPACNDPDPRTIAVDEVADPPWGAMEILPTRRTVQLRGMNAGVRDINCAPFSALKRYSDNRRFPLEEYKFFCQAYYRWSMRISCWTLKVHGKHRVPHVQVIRRANYYVPSWPDAPPYADPPYTFEFETWDGIEGFYDIDMNAVKWNFHRIRDERNLGVGSTKPRWSPVNWIVPRNYDDCYTHPFQFVWVRETDDPEPETEFYWNPDDPPPPSATNKGPFPSAIWNLVQAFQCVTGIRLTNIPYQVLFSAPAAEELCPPEETPDDPGPQAIIHRVHFPYFWPFTSFDAVDCECACADCACDPLTLPPARPGVTGGDDGQDVPGG